MPPQPLSSFTIKSGIGFGPSWLFTKPELMRPIMGVIAIWAHVETQISRILAQVLHADVHTAMAMYDAIISGPARSGAFLAAIDTALETPQANLVRAVMWASRPSRRVRNDFCHNLWGATQDLDALLLVPPSLMTTHHVFSRVQERSTPEMEEVWRRMNVEGAVFPHDKIQVWRANDLEIELREATRVMMNFGRLWACVAKAAEADTMQKELLSQPDVELQFEKATKENSH